MTPNPRHISSTGRISPPPNFQDIPQAGRTAPRRDQRPRMVALPGGTGVPPAGEPPFDCSIPRCSMRIARNLVFSFIIATVGGSILLFLIALLGGAS